MTSLDLYGKSRSLKRLILLFVGCLLISGSAFAQNYSLTLKTNNPALGSVTGGGVYVAGATATIVATPVANHLFLHWSDDNSIIATTRTITVNSDTTITAMFIDGKDSDGDGVPDAIDLDCDNDGILDSDELYCNNPSLPVATTSGSGKFKTQLGFFNFTGKIWSTVGQKHTVSETYNGITYTADVTYIYVDHRPKSLGSAHYPTDLATVPQNNSLVKPFSGRDINTWNSGPAWMIHRLYNVSSKQEVIGINGSASLQGEARFKVDVRAEKDGVPVPFQLVLFDGESTNFTSRFNWPEQIQFIDLNGGGFSLLEKAGSGNFDAIATDNTYFNISAKNIDLSSDGCVLSYNNTETSGVNALFQTKDYTRSNHSIEVRVRTPEGAQAFGFAVRTLCDIDKDGKPNFIDTDSDGDGCFDAVEGDEKVVLGHLNADGSIDITANGGVDAQGVPNLVNAGGAADVGGDVGQGVGEAYNAGVSNQCNNYWVGGTSGSENAWNTVVNWTQSAAPKASETIVFANNQNGDGVVAVADLHVPMAEGAITIGGLTNESSKAMVVPTGAGLVVTGNIVGSGTLANADRIVIKSEKDKPNGNLSFKMAVVSVLSMLL